MDAHTADVKELALWDSLITSAHPPFDLSKLPTDDSAPGALEALLAANRHSDYP